MAGIDAPMRVAWQFEAKALISLDRTTDRLKKEKPTTLPLGAIKQSPAVFQVRYESLAFAPGQSEQHVENLAKHVRKGETLDPVKVVAFGDEWQLVDGHHRIEAYREAGWEGEVPVEAITSDLSGIERVMWASQQGLAENKKDRLNIGKMDKQDAAWRAVVQEYGTKSQTARDFDVSERQIANMRAAKVVLLKEGVKVPALMGYGWRRASFEAKKLSGAVGDTDFDFTEKLKRDLAKRIAKVLEMRPPAVTLLEVLEAARPGITIELETAISMAKEDRALEI